MDSAPRRLAAYFLLLTLGALALPTRATEVYGTIANSFGVPYGGQVNTLEFTPLSAPQIYGTNTIEGGALTEDETLAAMELDPAQVQQIEQRRVLNIKAAYARSRSVVRSTVGATNPRSSNATSGTCWRHWSAGTRNWPRRVFTR